MVSDFRFFLMLLRRRKSRVSTPQGAALSGIFEMAGQHRKRCEDGGLHAEYSREQAGDVYAPFAGEFYFFRREPALGGAMASVMRHGGSRFVWRRLVILSFVFL